MHTRLNPVSHDTLDSAPAKRKYNQKLFSIVAPQYRRATVALSFGRDAFWKRKLVACLPRRDTGIIADIACGTGDVTELLCKTHPTCSIIGIDLSPRMLAEGRRQGFVGNAAVQDMTALGLRDASCEIVTGCYALRNAPDIDCALREARRVLKDDGIAAFLDFSRPENQAVAVIQHLLLGFWGSVWGVLLHGNPAVYGYIAKSLRHFPRRMELRRRMQEAGFNVVHSHLFFMGMLELIICRPIAS
jgi:demethylmenaquinone methyltransferase/2-methoxy-6-polyprenyl-1,4-benzoquinol methylase